MTTGIAVPNELLDLARDVARLKGRVAGFRRLVWLVQAAPRGGTPRLVPYLSNRIAGQGKTAPLFDHIMGALNSLKTLKTELEDVEHKLTGFAASQLGDEGGGWSDGIYIPAAIGDDDRLVKAVQAAEESLVGLEALFAVCLNLAMLQAPPGGPWVVVEVEHLESHANSTDGGHDPIAAAVLRHLARG